MFNKIITLLLITLIPSLGFSNWELNNNESRLSFVTTKQNDIAEVNYFKQLSGIIGKDRKAILKIDLNSVDTKIPLRDERMQTMLFETKKYPKAVMEIQLNETLNTLKVGDTTNLLLTGTLSLHGQRGTITSNAKVIKLTSNSVYVVSLEPLIINASTFDLTKGVDALRDIVQLTSISRAVSVTYLLNFVKTPTASGDS